jgi:tRNA(Ile)-lysidine synthase
MPSLVELSKNIIKNTHWYSNDVSVLIALSGGADSVFLMYLMRALPFKKIGVAHFNHQLRGHDSESDELFCKQLAKKHNTIFYTTSIDIVSEAKAHQNSIEEEGRIQRYNWLYSLLDSEKYDYILTGHHQDDNLETLLLNLYSGAGIKGMSCISTQNDRVIRPLLGITKQLILDYLTLNSIPYREDASNFESRFSRNYFRQKIGLIKNTNVYMEFINSSLPFIKANQDLYYLIRNDSNYINNQHVRYYNKGKISLGVEGLKKYFSPALKELFDICFKYVSNEQQGLSKNDFDSLIALMNGHIKSNKLSLPEKIKVYNEKRSLVFIDDRYFDWEEGEFKGLFENEYFKISYRTILPDWDTIIQSANDRLILGSFHGINIRHWKPNEVFTPFGQSRPKKISRVIQDHKVALHLRKNYPVLEYLGNVIWIPGVRKSEKIRLNTSNIKKREMIEIQFSLKEDS